MHPNKANPEDISKNAIGFAFQPDANAQPVPSKTTFSENVQNAPRVAQDSPAAYPSTIPATNVYGVPQGYSILQGPTTIVYMQDPRKTTTFGAQTNRQKAPFNFEAVYTDNSGHVIPQPFADAAVRRGFIRKVFSILTIQLVVTIAVACPFMFVPEVKRFVIKNPALFYMACVVSFVTVIAISCCEKLRRTFPHNMILLMFFTVIEGCLIGTISSFYDTRTVGYALGICTAVCFALTLFAFQTKIDFTRCWALLIAGSVILLLFIIIAIFSNSKVVHIIFLSFGALLFSFYLIFDVQIMMGGKHRHSISPEEYIFAALSLYMDVVLLFLYILQLLKLTQD